MKAPFFYVFKVRLVNLRAAKVFLSFSQRFTLGIHREETLFLWDSPMISWFKRMARRIREKALDFLNGLRIELTSGEYSPDSIPRQRTIPRSGKRKDLLGIRGEKLARNYYEESGASVLESNLIIGGCEIDLILLDRGALVFSEVKTRSGTSFDANPADAVDENRKSRMRRAADAYRKWHRLENAPLRFDIIAIYAPAGELPQLTHYRDAF